MQFLNLVLFGYVSKLLQEALQVASRHRSKTTHKMRGPCSDLRLYFLSQMNLLLELLVLPFLPVTTLSEPLT